MFFFFSEWCFTANIVIPDYPHSFCMVLWKSLPDDKVGYGFWLKHYHITDGGQLAIAGGCPAFVGIALDRFSLRKLNQFWRCISIYIYIYILYIYILYTFVCIAIQRCLLISLLEMADRRCSRTCFFFIYGAFSSTRTKVYGPEKRQTETGHRRGAKMSEISIHSFKYEKKIYIYIYMTPISNTQKHRKWIPTTICVNCLLSLFEIAT